MQVLPLLVSSESWWIAFTLSPYSQLSGCGMSLWSKILGAIWNLDIVAFNLDISSQKWQTKWNTNQGTTWKERWGRQVALTQGMGNDPRHGNDPHCGKLCRKDSAMWPALEVNVLSFMENLVLLPGTGSSVRCAFVVCFPLLLLWGSGFSSQDSLFSPLFYNFWETPLWEPFHFFLAFW